MDKDMRSREVTGGQRWAPGAKDRGTRASPRYLRPGPPVWPPSLGTESICHLSNSRKAPFQAAACLEPLTGALCLHIQEDSISHNRICDKGLAISNINEDK